MSEQRGTGIKGVRFSDLFWRTLEGHRNEAYYPGLRTKLLDFIRRKEQSLDPVSGRDIRFGSTNRHLTGIWHFAMVRNPDIVLFYTVDGGTLNLAMFGSHHDYPFSGKNFSAAPRTGGRVRNAVEGPSVDNPEWDSVRWSDPADLLRHPDLPELSAKALDGLMWDLMAEMQTGERYQSARGVAIEDTSAEEFERYINDLTAARDLVMEIRDRRPGAAYWLEKAPANFEFRTTALTV